MRLTVKLPAVVVGAILLTAIATGVVSIGIGRNVLRQAALDENIQRVEIYASAVLFYVANARSLLATTAELPELRSLAGPREVAALVLAHSGVFEYVTLLTPDGTVVMQEPRALEEKWSHRNLSFSAWFGEVRRTNRTVVSDLHISPATQRPTIVIATPVRAADGRTLGIWAGALKLGKISEIGSVTSGRLGPGGSGYVTDRHGLIIAHQTKPRYVEEQTDFNSVPSVSAALAGQQGTGELFNPIENEREFTAYRPLPDLGWAVVYAVPTGIALAPLDALTWGILSASVALAALIGVGVFVSARRTFAPLARLTTAAQTVAAGNLNFRLGIVGSDEIGTLSRAFDQMTDQLQASRTALEEKTAQLVEVNRELESFSYSVSHDLRAPLRAIDGFGQRLLDSCRDKLDASAVHYLDRIRAGTRLMAQLIDDLLNLSRVSRTKLNIQPVNLSALAQRIAAEMQLGEPQRGVELSIVIDANVQGDERLIEIALRNLLGNAWKFTSKRDHARIEFGVTRQDGDTVFFVRDNGAGFDMAYADKLFAPFQRLHSAAEFPGTGIGLVTVQRILQRHGGRIWAEAAMGQGATFYFTFGKGAEHGSKTDTAG
jgi:signal transduction histidine kinase